MHSRHQNYSTYLFTALQFLLFTFGIYLLYMIIYDVSFPENVQLHLYWCYKPNVKINSGPGVLNMVVAYVCGLKFTVLN